MNAAADHPLVTAIRANTLNGLPGWATELAAQCPGYRFAPCDVFRGRSVAAVRMTPGTGVHVVITTRKQRCARLSGCRTYRLMMHSKALKWSITVDDLGTL